MKKRYNVIRAFIAYTTATKIAFYKMIITQLKLNGNIFPQLPTPLENATVAVENLQSAFNKASNTKGLSTTDMHNIEVVADDIFRSYALYVELVANGKLATIQASGFHSSKEPEPTLYPILAVKNGPLSGSVKIRYKKMPGCKAYIIEQSLDGGKTWQNSGYCIRVTFEKKDLPIGATCLFRVAGIDTNGATDFTDPVSKIIE